MALSSSTNSSGNLLQGHLVSEKLGKNNHTLWKAQISATVRGARLQGHLTGASKKPAEEITATVDGKAVKKSNPEYEDWEA